MQGKAILKHAVLLTAANLSLRAVSLLFQIYLSGTVGAAGMGKLQLILTAGGFAMTFGTSGVRVAAMNLTAQETGLNRPAGVRRAISVCLTYGSLLSVAAGVGLWMLSPTIAASFIRDASVTAALRWLALSLPAACLSAVLSGYFTARGRIRPLVIVDIAERIVSIGLTVALLKLWAGRDTGRICSAIVGGSSLSTLLSGICLLILLQRELRAMPCSDEIPMVRRLLRLCLPLAVSDYLRSGLSTLEQFLIPRGLSRHGASFDASMASYGTITAMVFPVLMFPSAVFYALSDLLVPELSRCLVQGHKRRICHIVNTALRSGFVFAAFAAGLLFLLAPQLGQVLYHSPEAGKYLRQFAPLVLILYPDALTDGMLKGLGQQVASVRYNTVTAALDVLLLFLLLPRYGVAGFCCSFTVTHVLNFYLSLQRLMTVSDCVPDGKTAGKIAAALLFALLPAVRFSSPLLFAAVFLAMIRGLRILSPHDISLMMPKRASSGI